MSSPPSSAPPASGADRRAFRRAPLGVPVMLDAGSAWQKAECENVSGGGVAVRSTVDVPVGTLLDLYFELPTGIAVEASAEVIRRDGDRLALRFVEIDRELLVALRGFCRISGLHGAVKTH
jgi:PilZ domain